MTTTLNDNKLENVTNQVKASTILDQAKLRTADPPRDENVMLIDGLLNQSIRDKTACSGVPDLVFLVPCDTTGHKLSPDLSKGCFRISGKDIAKLSVHQICTRAENAGSTTGCGYEECLTTLDEAWYSNVIETIFCFSCYPTLHAIDLHQGCPSHQETKLSRVLAT